MLASPPQALWQSAPVNQAKLYRPPVKRECVMRPRLFERLDRGLDGALTLVCAAAGFGKTTLVASWLDACPLPSAWLALDAGDSEVGGFAQSLVAALRTVYPGACPATLALSNAQVQPPSSVFATTLTNDLMSLPERTVLVLDDYQSVQGLAVHDLLADMLHRWPLTLQLVLIARRNPPLPLPGLRARGQLVEIRSRDLRFTADETAAFVDRMLPLALGPSALHRLQQHTEGWAVGLHLASLSLAATADAEALLTTLAGTDASLTDYLVDEVLSHLPESLHTFLLKVSILSRMCDALCRAVVGPAEMPDGAGTSMEWLERAELLVVPLDERREWYRFHHLFQELLVRRLHERVTSDEIHGLHRRAALWLAENGMVDDAVPHALATDDLDLAATLTEQDLANVLNREDRRTLERRLSLLPETLIQRRPWLLVARAWSMQYLSQSVAQAQALRQAEALVAGGDATSPVADGAGDLAALRGHIAVFQGHDAFFRNEPDEAVTRCRESLALLGPSWPYVRGNAQLFLALGLQAQGLGPEAERLLLDEYQLGRDPTQAYRTRLLFARSLTELQSGHLDQAARAARRMLEQATDVGLAILSNWARFLLGVVHYQWNDLERAAHYFGAILDDRYLAHESAVRQGTTGLAYIHLARSETGRAWQLTEEQGALDLARFGQEAEPTRALQALVQLARGDVAGAGRWADAAADSPPDQPWLWLPQPRLIRARVLLARRARDDVPQALTSLDGLLVFTRQAHNVRFEIEVRALRALALATLGRATAAQAELRQAVQLAHPGGFLRAFVDLGGPMQTLLAQLAATDGVVAPAHRILDAFPAAGPAAPGDGRDTGRAPAPAHRPQVLPEPLTARELEILGLLAQPLSGKQIARRLDISLATYKRHTSNIYGKLEVHRRWDAVARAAELDILPHA